MISCWCRRTAYLAQKEISLLAGQPLTYVSSAVLTASCAAVFFLGGRFFVPGSGSSDLRFFFSAIPYVSVLVVPSLTMGQWEQRSFAFDQTLPVSDGQLVLGKWLASSLVASAMLLPGLSVPVCVSLFGTVDIAQLATGYAGIVCFQWCACALGVLVASVCNGRVASFFVTALVLLSVCVVHVLPAFVELPRWLASLCRGISFAWHFDAAGKGIIDSRDIVFYAALSAAMLLSSAELLRARKRGGL